MSATAVSNETKSQSPSGILNDALNTFPTDNGELMWRHIISTLHQDADKAVEGITATDEETKQLNDACAKSDEDGSVVSGAAAQRTGRRRISNRIAAARCRKRKAAYIESLETVLQECVHKLVATRKQLASATGSQQVAGHPMTNYQSTIPPPYVMMQPPQHLAAPIAQPQQHPGSTASNHKVQHFANGQSAPSVTSQHHYNQAMQQTVVPHPYGMGYNNVASQAYYSYNTVNHYPTNTKKRSLDANLPHTTGEQVKIEHLPAPNNPFVPQQHTMGIAGKQTQNTPMAFLQTQIQFQHT